jgi:hypothetical protein
MSWPEIPKSLPVRFLKTWASEKLASSLKFLQWKTALFSV